MMKVMNLGSRSARHVPLEILTEILVHLPCESLARCKIVCKQWYSCINNSRYFLEKHSTIHPPYFLSLGHTPSEAAGAESCVSTETTRPVHFSSVVVVADGNGHRHQSYNDKTVPSCYDKIVSSSCGYVCLRGGTSNRSLAVFNPTTNDIVTLPDLTDAPPDQSSDGSSPHRYLLNKLGFGYDTKSKKYKVVHILADCRTRISSCSVLTVSRWCASSSSSWRAVHDESLPSSSPDGWWQHVCVNGVIYWVNFLGGTNECAEIITFDLSSENFNTIMSPVIIYDNFFPNSHALNNYLVELNSKLCYVETLSDAISRMVQMDLWMLDDTPNPWHGSSSSGRLVNKWTHMHRLELGQVYDSASWNCPYSPRRIDENNQRILMWGENDGLSYYDIKGKSLHNCRRDDGPDPKWANFWASSLRRVGSSRLVIHSQALVWLD